MYTKKTKRILSILEKEIVKGILTRFNWVVRNKDKIKFVYFIDKGVLRNKAML